MPADAMTADPTDNRYAEGQIWEYRTRPEDEGSLLKIQKIELLPAFADVGPVYHVSVIGLNFKDVPLEDSIQHLPLSKASLDASVTSLSSSQAVFPDPDEGIAEWKQNYGNVFDDTVAEVVSLAVAVMVPNTEILNSLAVETLETVIFVGEDAISCKIKIEHVSNVLEAIENGRNISIEMRNDRAYQMQNRMHTYDVIMSEGWHRDFVPIVASDVLWLTLNHYSAGRWLTDLLDETVKRHGFAVLSISIGYPTEGRVDGTAWGITIADKPVDVRDRLKGLLSDQVEIAENTVIDDGAHRGMMH